MVACRYWFLFRLVPGEAVLHSFHRASEIVGMHVAPLWGLPPLMALLLLLGAIARAAIGFERGAMQDQAAHAQFLARVGVA